MAPQAVDQRTGEERVFGLGHPVDEGVSRVFLGSELGDGAVEKLRFQPLAGDRIRVVQRDIRRREVRRRLTEILATEPRVEARQSVIILLTPAFIRVMVTLRALQSQPEKDLRRVGRRLMKLVVARLPEPVDGRRIGPLATGGDDAADELVVGTVPRDHVLQPVVKGIRRPVGPGEVRVPQDRSPLHGEVSGIVGRREQSFDDGVSFGRAILIGGRCDVGLERASFLDGWQSAAQVNSDSTEERRVVTWPGRLETQLLPLLDGQLIDEILRCETGDARERSTLRTEDSANGHLSHVTSHDGRFACRFVGGDESVITHDGDDIEIARIHRLARHIAAAAIGILGQHGKLLLLVDVHHPLGRRHDELRHARCIRSRCRRPRLNPRENQPIRFGSRFDPPASAMRNRRRSLE